jgi:hypothetical protein
MKHTNHTPAAHMYQRRHTRWKSQGRVAGRAKRSRPSSMFLFFDSLSKLACTLVLHVIPVPCCHWALIPLLLLRENLNSRHVYSCQGLLLAWLLYIFLCFDLASWPCNWLTCVLRPACVSLSCLIILSCVSLRAYCQATDAAARLTRKTSPSSRNRCAMCLYLKLGTYKSIWTTLWVALMPVARVSFVQTVSTDLY